ncbi:MAG TPA: YceI family protein [Microbacteriaceae bacterium]
MAGPSDGDHSRILNHVLVPPAGEFQLDPVHTFVSFTVQHLVAGRVRARFETVQETVTVAEDISASTLEVSIDTASLTTLNPIRDADLRSEHFLDVEHYPTMTYRSTTVSALPDAAGLVPGELTLHGVTRPVELTVRFGGSLIDPSGNIRVAFRAHGTIARRDFGLTYEIVKEAGALLVGKDVTIDIDAEAIRPQ